MPDAQESPLSIAQHVRNLLLCIEKGGRQWSIGAKFEQWYLRSRRIVAAFLLGRPVDEATSVGREVNVPAIVSEQRHQIPARHSTVGPLSEFAVNTFAANSTISGEHTRKRINHLHSN